MHVEHEEYLRVTVRMAVEDRTGAPTLRHARKLRFWASGWTRNESGCVTFLECDEDGENDARAVAAGNGGTLRLTVAHKSDILSALVSDFDFKYGELIVRDRSRGDHDIKLDQIRGKVAGW